MIYSEYRHIENQHAAYFKVQTSVSHILTTFFITHHTGWSIRYGPYLFERLEDFEDQQGGTEELADCGIFTEIYFGHMHFVWLF